MKTFRQILKGLGLLLVTLAALAAAFVLVLTVTEYRPADRESVAVEGAAAGETGRSLTLVTWNIGYGALGDNADFFMDGGTGVRTASAERVDANLAAMADALRAQDPDLVFLQEVDVSSTRSHLKDERNAFLAALPGRAAAYATNYRSLYIPFPWPPIGKVEAGLMTLTRLNASSAERVQLPCPFSWPMRLANLKRCLLVTRIPVDGKELVAVNLHLEAYDDGEGKAAQTAMLAELLQQEAAKGNWVIAGGDFNQIFSNAEGYPVKEGLWAPGAVDVAALGEGLSALMDSRVPSCRSLDRPLAGADPADFQYYLIDGWIVSANVQVEELSTLDEGFAATDHNPVLLKVTLTD